MQHKPRTIGDQQGTVVVLVLDLEGNSLALQYVRRILKYINKYCG